MYNTVESSSSFLLCGAENQNMVFVGSDCKKLLSQLYETKGYQFVLGDFSGCRTLLLRVKLTRFVFQVSDSLMFVISDNQLKQCGEKMPFSMVKQLSQIFFFKSCGEFSFDKEYSFTAETKIFPFSLQS